MDLSKPDLGCNLCGDIVIGDQKARVAHVETHLIEIALSVLPANGDDDVDEDSQIEEIEGQSPVTASVSLSQKEVLLTPQVKFGQESNGSLRAGRNAPGNAVEKHRCDFCGKRFSKIGNLVRHHKFSCPEKRKELLPRQACQIEGCNLTFTRPDALVKHLKHVHGGDQYGQSIGESIKS
jgi:uncharacterized Zn-finger protein